LISNNLRNPFSKEIKEDNCILVKTLNPYLHIENSKLKLFTYLGCFSKQICRLLLNINKGSLIEVRNHKFSENSNSHFPKERTLEKYKKIQLFKSHIIENILDDQSLNKLQTKIDPLISNCTKNINKIQRNVLLKPTNSDICNKYTTNYKINEIKSQHTSRIKQFSERTLKKALIIEHPLFLSRKFLNYEIHTPSKIERKYNRSFAPYYSQTNPSRKLYFQKVWRPSTDNFESAKSSISKVYNLKKPILQDIKPVEINYPQL